jgi:hypothetical protein
MRSILLLLAVGCLVAEVRAQTFAEVLLTHFTHYVQTPTGTVVLEDRDLDFNVRVDSDTSGGDSIFGNLHLEPGAQTVLVYDYTITLSIRGVHYDGPRDRYCTPLAFGSQCVQSSGGEGAFAQIIVGTIDPRSAPPFLNLTSGQVTQKIEGISGPPSALPRPDRIVQSGQVRAVASTSSNFGTNVFLPEVLVFVNVFAAPIPEASTWASMLAGFAVLAAMMRWRRGARTNATLRLSHVSCAAARSVDVSGPTGRA